MLTWGERATEVGRRGAPSLPRRARPGPRALASHHVNMLTWWGREGAWSPGGLCEYRVGEAGPGLRRPRAEVEVGEAAERELRLGVDPEERAAAAEVAERARRVARARPVGRLAVAELEAETPVVR